jgi:photosystem II stability/assembly factor-like uncharacterized protein
MKKIIYIFIVSLIFFFLIFESSVFNISADRESGQTKKSESGIQYEINYFKQWHYPLGNVIPQSRLNEIQLQLSKLPRENDINVNPVNSWICLGPYGMNMKAIPNIKFSGRILDVEITPNASIRIAAASGGLWGYSGVFPVSLSDNLDNTIAIGSFASKPGDRNTIIVGTGEPYLRSGQGIYLTSDAGSSWTQSVTDIGSPDGVFKIRYLPGSTDTIFAVTTTGLYRSDNGGLLFNRKLAGVCSDLLINPGSTNRMWSAVWNSGVYQSTNSGETWTQILSLDDFGRASLSIGAGNYLYMSVAKNSTSSMLGVYRSSNYGANWVTISPLNDIFFNGGYQGWFDNVISASPRISGLVMVGGISLHRSTNYGITWDQLPSPNIHPDQHSIVWNSTNDSVIVGNDGGITISADNGVTWSNISNRFPITQYTGIAVSGNFSHLFTGEIFGGSQDNGYSGTTNFGNAWYQTNEGDGGGMSIDPNNPNVVWGTLSSITELLFSRSRSTDYGQNWTTINNGFESSFQWFTKIRNDQSGNINIYSNSDNFVYYSTNRGDLWQKLNQTQFPAIVNNVNVSVYSAPSAVVYACLNDTASGSRLRVYDNNTWYERSSELASQIMVRSVAQHPSDNNTAYALMNGMNSLQKIYKTTNRGINWVNITGDLPNVPLADLVPHPTDPDKLYLGTEFGCFKTSNGGMNWVRWNNGMPASNIITEMCYADSTTINGKFYIIAGTYGRGVYARDISGDDPIGVKKIANNIPRDYMLIQNYPNPFNPATIIEFSLPVKDIVEIQVYDILGKRVSEIVNRVFDAGQHKITFNASGLSSGIYFYRLNTPRFTDTKKMLLIK